MLTMLGLSNRKDILQGQFRQSIRVFQGEKYVCSIVKMLIMPSDEGMLYIELVHKITIKKIPLYTRQNYFHPLLSP